MHLRSVRGLIFYFAAALLLIVSISPVAADAPKHTFTIGEKDFLLDGNRLQIRCGELHYLRIPREYWRHRLQMCKAMGLNTVCAYLFWNRHEQTHGTFDWKGQADVAEFCRIAQQEGLWVILRPGPYACAEWEMGGLPWWFLKKDNIALRTKDPFFVEHARAWLKEVGRVLAPLQITNGGPILMAQVENEYGSYGKDVEYMGMMRQAMLDAGFNVPLFTCNPSRVLPNGYRADLFAVVNFGGNPEVAFKALRNVRRNGPLMCGEFYPGWFDSWGVAHSLGTNSKTLRDLEYMLANNASFSIYMVHGGTSFGLWAGADDQFRPITTSYDYDAPISENGAATEKYYLIRDLFKKYLLPGETLPEPPAANPTIEIPHFMLTQCAPVFSNLPKPIEDQSPRTMEYYNQGYGCILYSTTIPAGPAAKLVALRVHDFGFVYINGQLTGVMDRRNLRFNVDIPARAKPARLDILVEPMGRVNIGGGIHDRKGLSAPVKLVPPSGDAVTLTGWNVCNLPLNDTMLAKLHYGKAQSGPAFYKGTFKLDKSADTYLDMRVWGKGVVWVNGHCLGRFWNIGPEQTLYLPGPWLKKGKNEVVVLDILGPEKPELAGLSKPILDQVRSELDFFKSNWAGVKLVLDGVEPVYSGTFARGAQAQEVLFGKTVKGRQLCLETLNAYDDRLIAAVAEMDVLDANGNPIKRSSWKIAYADSEEEQREDGTAINAIDGKPNKSWVSQWDRVQPNHPHRLVIDLGQTCDVSGIKYLPRQGDDTTKGRIKDYRVYVSEKALVVPAIK